MTTNQEGKHASFRTIGSGSGDYNGDAIAAMLAEGASGSDFNGIMTSWLQIRTGDSTKTNLNDLQATFAAQQGFARWSDINTIPATAGIIKSIQQIEFTIASGAATGTDTITSVDTANTVLFYSYGFFGGKRQTSIVSGFDHIDVRVDLTNGTTVTATRGLGDTFAIDVVCTVVEYTAAAISSIQQGTVDITTGASSGTDTITSVNTARSVVLYNGSSTGRTNAVPVGGIMSALSLTNATTVTATRANTFTSSTLSTNYTVIEFAPGVVNSIQEFNITITNSGNTTNTATIANVDTTRAFIFPGGVTSTVSLVDLAQDVCHVQLTNGTTLTATRNTASATVPGVAGTVVEFVGGTIKSIQRSTLTMQTGNTTENDTVTAVDTALSVLTTLGASGTSTSAWDPEEEHFTSKLFDATTVRYQRGVSGRVWTAPYELVEYVA